MAKTAKKISLYVDSIPDELKHEFKKVMDTEAVLMEYAAIKTDADKIAWVDKYGVGLLCVVRSVKVQTGYASVEPEPEKIVPKSTDSEFKWFFSKGHVCRPKDGIRFIKSVLAGNTVDIGNAFTWAMSPQGSSHWSAVQHGGPLDDKSRQHLETLVAIAENEGIA